MRSANAWAWGPVSTGELLGPEMELLRLSDNVSLEAYHPRCEQ